MNQINQFFLFIFIISCFGCDDVAFENVVSRATQQVQKDQSISGENTDSQQQDIEHKLCSADEAKQKEQILNDQLNRIKERDQGSFDFSNDCLTSAYLIVQPDTLDYINEVIYYNFYQSFRQEVGADLNARLAVEHFNLIVIAETLRKTLNREGIQTFRNGTSSGRSVVVDGRYAVAVGVYVATGDIQAATELTGEVDFTGSLSVIQWSGLNTYKDLKNFKASLRIENQATISKMVPSESVHKD